VWRRPAAVDWKPRGGRLGHAGPETRRASALPAFAQPAPSRVTFRAADRPTRTYPPRHRRSRGLLDEPLRAALAPPPPRRSAVLAQHTTAVRQSRPFASLTRWHPKGDPASGTERAAPPENQPPSPPHRGAALGFTLPRVVCCSAAPGAPAAPRTGSQPDQTRRGPATSSRSF
jgi:hypothetical protein